MAVVPGALAAATACGQLSLAITISMAAPPQLLKARHRPHQVAEGLAGVLAPRGTGPTTRVKRVHVRWG